MSLSVLPVLMSLIKVNLKSHIINHFDRVSVLPSSVS